MESFIKYFRYLSFSKVLTFSFKDAVAVKILIAKLNQEKDNLPSKVYICSGYVEDDCLGSSWMLQPSLTYSDRPIQRQPYPGAIPTKLQYKPVTE